MTRTSSRIQEMQEKSAVSCMWGLFSILESCHGLQNHMVISKGRPPNRNIIDYPRQLGSIACFDEECRKIHNGADVRSIVGFDDRRRSMRNCVEEEMHIEKQNSKREIVKRQQFAKMDAELLDRLVKTRKKTRKGSREVYQPSSCCLNNAARLMNEMPSTSAEVSLNKLTLAAILGAVCAQNHQEESKLSEYFQRNSFLEKYDEDDEISIQQVQTRAKAFVDQMFILREGRKSESKKSFSNALEVLNSKRDLFMELLPDPNSTLARRIKKLNPSQIEKNTIQSVLGADISECCPSARYGSTLAKLKGNTRDVHWKKFDYQLKLSPEKDFTAQHSDKIVILKPAPRNGKHSCNCSSMQFPQKPNTRVSEAKTTSFSFREIKRKLKHRFGATKKEADVGSECNCLGANSFDSPTKAPKKGKMWKKQELKSIRGSDIACVADTTRRKLCLSSSNNNKGYDVILEAKRHLSMRLNNLNSIEDWRSKKSPRTLERILSSPENDRWPFSPRRDSLYVSGSAEMRYSPYNTSPRVVESSSRVRNEVRPNTEVTSYDDHSGLLQTVDAMTCSVTLKTEAEARDSNIFTSDDMKIDGESRIAETESSLPPELHDSQEVLSETTSTSFTVSSEAMDTVEPQKCDCIDSLTENEAITSAPDDFPSTHSNNHRLDTVENIKFQEEHESPVSVLEPFFVEDANTPPRITLQTGRKQMQPRHLDFEECSFESFPVTSHSSMEEEMCQYVQLVMEASSLNWNQLQEMRYLPEELLHESLFDEVELPPLDCYYDPKLLFDHINEVLVEIYNCHFYSPLSLASPSPKIRSTPLAEVVLDEILEEADFFLLPTTEKRTLDQLVSKDVVRSRSWLDVRTDTEHIVNEVSEAVMEESVLDILLEFHT